jgi:tetratricopeptide (TPR) repeat protein
MDLGYFTGESSAEGFSKYAVFKRRLLGYLSFALNYSVHGVDVRGYHTVNTAIHVVCALLVYMLVLSAFCQGGAAVDLREGKARWTAFFAALIFASHPVQTQAVTYIVQRFASLAAMFSLASLNLYAWGRITRGVGKRWVMLLSAALMAVCAMKVKENAFVVPLLAVAYEAVFFKGPGRKRIIFLSPLLLTMVIVPVSLLLSGGVSIEGFDEATRVRPDIGRMTYILTQAMVIVTYLRLFLLPVNQNLDYDYPAVESVLAPGFLISALVLASLFSAGLWAYLRGRGKSAETLLVAFGIFWFFIALSVESGLVPLAFIYEHRLYLPSVGLCMSAAAGIYILFEGTGRDVYRPLLLVMVFSVPAMFLLTTHERNAIWGSQVSLWEDVRSKSPRKARVHNNLGSAFSRADRLGEAEQSFEAALALDPDHPAALDNLGTVYRRRGRLSEAKAMHLRALVLSPGFTEAANNLALAYSMEGDYAKAGEMYGHALSLSPEDPVSLNNVATEHMRNGRLEEAEALYLRALKVRPHYVEAHYNLATLYYRRGRVEEAFGRLHDLVKQYPAFKSARYNLANFYLTRDMPREAAVHYRAVLELDPRDLKANVNLATAYYKLGEVDMSIRHLREALDIAPEDREAHYNLGIALSSKGLEDEAGRHFAIAERLGRAEAGK